MRGFTSFLPFFIPIADFQILDQANVACWDTDLILATWELIQDGYKPEARLSYIVRLFKFSKARKNNRYKRGRERGGQRAGENTTKQTFFTKPVAVVNFVLSGILSPYPL